MAPLSLLLAALATGATAATQVSTAPVSKDSSAGLRALILKRFAGKQAAATARTADEKEEETWKLPRQKSRAEVGADRDEAMLQRAHQLLKQINPQQASQGQYHSTRGEAEGKAIGENAQVEHTWKGEEVGSR